MTTLGAHDVARAAARPAGRLAAWLGGLDALEREVRDELQAHVDELAQAYVLDGHHPNEAARLARVRFGNFEAHVAACLSERWRSGLTMRMTLTITLIACALLLSLGQTGRLREEVQETRAELRSILALLEQDRAERNEPVPRPAVLRIGDELTVYDELNSDHVNARVRIGVDGMALLPELGWVAVHGKERGAFERELTEQYAKLFQETRVRVVPADSLPAPSTPR